MSNTNTGGPAYPSPRWEGWGSPQEGMTLRDYFAAKAMQAILQEKDVHDSRQWHNTAWIAYQVSDEMLKARQA